MWKRNLNSTPVLVSIAIFLLFSTRTLTAFSIYPHRSSARGKSGTPSTKKIIALNDNRPIRGISLQSDKSQSEYDDRNTTIFNKKSAPHHHVLVLGSISVIMLLAAVPLILSPAYAIDHPVDFPSLKIPNPIPDADPRYFISGGICAAVSHGATTPIDVVKTKMQSAPERFNRGLQNAAKDIIAENGIQTLAVGLGPTVVGYGIEGALKFGLYESLKPSFVNLLSLSDPTEGYLAASVTAGAVASTLLCPMEQTRIRLVTDQNFATGFLDGFARLVREEGVGNIFYGLPAMLSKQVPYVSLKVR
jgi:hypothetical protein